MVKEIKETKKSRILYNPNQTADVQIYYDHNHHAVNIDKNGTHFSLDKEMDESIEFLKKQGLVEKK